MIENHIAAERDYKEGMKYKDLAKKYEVSINTVKSWKQRYAWERTKGAHKEKSVHTNKGGAPPEVKPSIVINDDSLNDKQILFVSYYLKYWNATKAYQKAYGCDYETAKTNGSRLLTNAHIKEEVIRVRDEMFSDALLTPQAIIQKYMDIAFADITDFMEFGSKEEPYLNEKGEQILDPETGDPLTYKRNFVYFNNGDHIDGTILSEVKQGKDGASIKLSDRMKALEKLEKYMGMMSEEQQLKINKLNLEIKQISGDGAGDAHEQNKGYIDALNNQVEQEFADEVNDDEEE